MLTNTMEKSNVTTVRYKYGSNLRGESLLRNAFRSGLADWNTKQNKRYFSISDSASES